MVIPDNGHDPKLMTRLRLRAQWVLVLLFVGLILVNHRWILLQLKNYLDTH